MRALVVVANERINSGRETRSDSEEASVDVVTARHSERIDLVSDARLRKSRFARSCGGPGRPFKEGNASAATLEEQSLAPYRVRWSSSQDQCLDEARADQ